MNEPSWRRHGPRARAAALVARAGILLTGALAASAAHAKDPGIRDCPDVSGHYRVVRTVEGPSMAEALQALHAGMANFIGSEVRLEGPRAGRLLVWVKSGSTGVLPPSPSPSAELKQGSDFSCANGWVKLARVADSSRRIDEGWYEGRSTAAITRAPRGGLLMQVNFSGRQRTTIYSYDSARISLPKLGTGRSLTESMRLPDISEPAPEPPAGSRAAGAPPPPPEHPAVAGVRQLLTSQVLGNAVLGPLRPSGNAVLVILTAKNSDAVLQFEDRMRAAEIAYRVERQPIWSNNVYRMELLVWPRGTASAPAARPSILRVEHEVRRLCPPLVDVQGVQTLGEGYVVALSLMDQTSVDDLVARIKAHAPLFRGVAVLGESSRPDAPKLRTARLLLTVR
jgi:hypothetical protein